MQLWQLAIVFAVAFAVTYLLVPVSKRFSYRIGAIDYPAERRMNDHAVPRAGGLALYGGFSAGCVAAAVGVRFFGWETGSLFVETDLSYPLLFTGLSLMFLLGLVDDMSPMSARSKLAGQILAAAVIYGSGVTIGAVWDSFSGQLLDLDWADAPLTIFYILVFVNVVNLIDGLDGLAAGLVAIMACSLLFLSLRRSNYILVVASVALIACCVAFLRFNFHPASIFMGDSGSHLLGSLVAIISIMGVVRMQSLVVSLVPLVIAGVPVLDTASAVVRRIREGKSIGAADKEHVHHRLVESGLGQRRSVLILYALSAVFAVVGYYINTFHGFVRWALFAIFAVVVFVVVARLRLLDPVLAHHYRRQEKAEPRRKKKQAGR